MIAIRKSAEAFRHLRTDQHGFYTIKRQQVKKEKKEVGTLSAGKILSINIGKKVGAKKDPAEECRLIADFGIEGDAHGGILPNRQVSLLATESIEKIRNKGLDIHYGDFAENLTTEGIVLHLLPLGTKLKIGKEVLTEVSQIGKVCHDRCAIFHTIGDCVMPREGIFVRVLSDGVIRVGDEITLES
ncbi:MAG: MOSC domain protein [Syntrophus sp. PtaB.Bin075]|nr:MAG: MOSC domain protein [Syntrophus sp. PtaB.Bin075]